MTASSITQASPTCCRSFFPIPTLDMRMQRLPTQGRHSSPSNLHHLARISRSNAGLPASSPGGCNSRLHRRHSSPNSHPPPRPGGQHLHPRMVRTSIFHLPRATTCLASSRQPMAPGSVSPSAQQPHIRAGSGLCAAGGCPELQIELPSRAQLLMPATPPLRPIRATTPSSPRQHGKSAEPHDSTKPPPLRRNPCRIAPTSPSAFSSRAPPPPPAPAAAIFF